MADKTPMMKQYESLKSKHPDKLLFFRLGDFYEMFGEDALKASKILGITLTHRQAEPMCGVPHHAVQPYIKKLLDAGERIAVCEQTGNPLDGKGMFTREIVEILTPGTLVEDSFLNAQASNYLMALHWQGDKCALAVGDFSTGEILTTQIRWNDGIEALRREIVRFQPKEILIKEEIELAYPMLDELLKNHSYLISRMPPWAYASQTCLKRVLDHFSVQSPRALGWTENSLEIIPLGILLDYALQGWPGQSLDHLKKLSRYRADDFMELDEATFKSLELLQGTRGESENTLFSVLNQTKTAPGSRLLRHWIQFPLKKIEPLFQRQDDIDLFMNSSGLITKIREILTGMSDWERLCARLSLDKASPRDLLGLGICLEKNLQILNIGELDIFQSRFEYDLNKKQELDRLRTLIDKAILPEPAMNLLEGGVIASGYDSQLDQDRFAQDHGGDLLDSYLKEEQTATGISTLKIRQNKIIGYYFEFTKSQINDLPDYFHRKQSLIGSERYSTVKLEELQRTLYSAKDRVVEREKVLFQELKSELRKYLGLYRQGADLCSYSDVCQSLAWAALQNRYIRPVLTLNRGLNIQAGRHPVVEASLKEQNFIPNPIVFTNAQVLHLLTGPNMAGKSTFLRQTALIVLMAQIGSPVPASEATIGLVDQIFCRVGASDDLARGESTFLVEMNETANILRRATSSSLVIMDEVGRGTSTRDGLSLAWAICEYLLNHVGAITLFATHYHELTGLDHPLKNNFCLSVWEDGSDVVFLRQVIPGASDHSYGIHVAKLAGIPSEVLQRAQAILDTLLPSSSADLNVNPPLQNQISLFPSEEIVKTKILSLDINKLTPLEALQLLADLQKELK